MQTDMPAAAGKSIRQKMSDMIRMRNKLKNAESEGVSEHAASEFTSNAERAERNVPSESEVLESIQEAYFSADLDVIAYELGKLPPTLDVNEINVYRRMVRQQLAVVSKKVSDLILEHHPSFSAQLWNIAALKESVAEVCAVCQDARRRIQAARDECTTSSLKVLSLYRKRQYVSNALILVRLILALLNAEKRALELIKAKDFTGAIGMCEEAVQTVQLCSTCYAVRSLGKRLQCLKGTVEEKLNVAAAEACFALNREEYEKVLTAYRQLTTTENAMERLIEQFLLAIDNTASAVLERFQEQDDLSDRDFETLCKNIRIECLPLCVRELLQLIWHLLFAYHNVLWWYESDSSIEGKEEKEVAYRTLESRAVNVWNKACSKLCILVRHTDFQQLSFEQFSAVLNLCSCFMAYAMPHIGENSSLGSMLQEKSAAYCQALHENYLVTVGTYIKSDAWEKVPLDLGFGVRQLPEFQAFFSHVMNDKRQEDDRTDCFPVFHMKPAAENPFADEDDKRFFEAEERKGKQNSNADLTEDESAGDSCPEEESYPTGNPSEPLQCEKMEAMDPILSNSALMLLRCIGRYLNIASASMSVAFKAITCMFQLFNFYFLMLFKVMMPPEDCSSMPSSLRFHVDLMEQILGAEVDLAPSVALYESFQQYKGLFGLAERLVAVESLLYVAREIYAVREGIEALLPPSKRACVLQFNAQTLKVVPQSRNFVYGLIGRKAIDCSYAVERISRANWDLHELMSQHSEYIDDIIKELMAFNKQLHFVHAVLQIPKEAHALLWESCIKKIFEILVEGFAQVQKSSAEGRALMQLDFQHLLMYVSRLSGEKQIAGKEFVEDFIKAYYIPEASMADWIKDNKSRYAKHQLESVLNASVHLSLKTRQRLIAAVATDEDNIAE